MISQWVSIFNAVIYTVLSVFSALIALKNGIFFNVYRELQSQSASLSIYALFLGSGVFQIIASFGCITAAVLAFMTTLLTLYYERIFCRSPNKTLKSVYQPDDPNLIYCDHEICEFIKPQCIYFGQSSQNHVNNIYSIA